MFPRVLRAVLSIGLELIVVLLRFNGRETSQCAES